jgi:hypothetical protein
MSIDPAGLEKTEAEKEGQKAPAEESDLLEALQVTKEEKAQLPQDLILDPQKQFTPQQRDFISQSLLKMSMAQKIRLALVGNQETRNLLIHDPNKIIPLAVLRNPNLSEDEVIMYAQLRSLPEDVFSAMAKHKTWVKNYQVKLALVSNPKAPLSLAIKLLDHLHDRDLQNISKSKNVSYILARSAARLLFKRKG